jgi:hypothetical protein
VLHILKSHGLALRPHNLKIAIAQREKLEGRLQGIRRRMDEAYSDKLDGKIPEDFWARKSAE